jgi:hypothetical protein
MTNNIQDKRDAKEVHAAHLTKMNEKLHLEDNNTPPTSPPASRSEQELIVGLDIFAKHLLHDEQFEQRPVNQSSYRHLKDNYEPLVKPPAREGEQL